MEITENSVDNDIDEMSEYKILVVDDSATIRELLRKSFAGKGYAVDAAESAEKALELIEQTTYPVMFFDLNLPGMNGVELCKKVKKEYPLSVMFAMTGFASLFALSVCRDAGFEDYFIKPVNLQLCHYATQEAFKKIKRWSRSFSD